MSRAIKLTLVVVSLLVGCSHKQWIAQGMSKAYQTSYGYTDCEVIGIKAIEVCESDSCYNQIMHKVECE